MVTRTLYASLIAGLGLTTLTGCGATRPEPLMVQPDFSYVEQTPRAQRASIWAASDTNLADASRPERP